jgi:hypothetical protein
MHTFLQINFRLGFVSWLFGFLASSKTTPEFFIRAQLLRSIFGRVVLFTGTFSTWSLFGNVHCGYMWYCVVICFNRL